MDQITHAGIANAQISTARANADPLILAGFYKTVTCVFCVFVSACAPRGHLLFQAAIRKNEAHDATNKIPQQLRFVLADRGLEIAGFAPDRT
ncbi:MAG: hypothetical protein OER77_07225 [Myxococcales bacterium]|nr:hypothetical protein [Myxococcales bacterium]